MAPRLTRVPLCALCVASLGFVPAEPVPDWSKRADGRPDYGPVISALETPDIAFNRPARGSHPSGTHWYYNNWDFNVLGTIFERETKTTIYQAFREQIAQPLGMEDFRVEDGGYQSGPESKHPGYPVRMTARDLARYGLLYLRAAPGARDAWSPPDWVRESTKAHSDTGTCGYGYMWWVAANGRACRGSTCRTGRSGPGGSAGTTWSSFRSWTSWSFTGWTPTSLAGR